MSTPTFPSTVYPAESSFYLRFNTQLFESPLNRTRQTLELGGAKWHATLFFEQMKASEARALEAFLAALRGGAMPFHLWDHRKPTPAGSGAGTPLVNGAAQTGTTLATDGWSASAAGVLLPGDLFAVGGELKMITAQADADAGGAATLAFEPALRNSPGDDAAITITAPTGIFKLAGDEAARPRSSGPLTAITLEAVEDV